MAPIHFPLLAAAIALAASAICAGPALAKAPLLFADCRGAPTASPTVILEAGAFGTSADWDRVLDDLSKGGRVCAYDRSGLGRSPPPTGGLGVIARAHELADVLDQIGETKPVILVGHSNGALYVEAFARLWPARVAGLVYVNGVGSDDAGHPILMHELAQERQLSALAAGLGDLGLGGLVADALSEPGLSPAAAARKRAALTCRPCLHVARDEDRQVEAGVVAVTALPDDVRRIPTAVIVGSPDPPDWREPRAWRVAESAPALRAEHGWILQAQGASHVSPLARDRAYIDAAVAWLRSPYQAPMFSIAVHGSAGAKAPPF
jgi:pimeloyl-ACP methyl ester carboxylesterase